MGSPYPQTAEVREKVLDQLADAQRDLLNGLDDRLYALEHDQPPESGQSCGGGGSIGTTAPSGPRSASDVLCGSKGVSGVMESTGGGMRWLVAGFGVVALLVAGCASGSFGMVAGTFQGVAGPVSPSGSRRWGRGPLSGVVRFTEASGHTVEVTAGASGKFSVRLAPGTYSVAGVTSEFGAVDPHSGMSQPPCAMQNMSSTRVRAGQTDWITLICSGP
jgi:hypothetical protein